ncbi:MAG: hypothetical protein NXI00_05925 [Cytophagales bacterium]|nr:hypothetical protein [Cytophagales bacterium]
MSTPIILWLQNYGLSLIITLEDKALWEKEMEEKRKRLKHKIDEIQKSNKAKQAIIQEIKILKDEIEEHFENTQKKIQAQNLKKGTKKV